MGIRRLWRYCVLSVVCCWATSLGAQQNPNGQIPVAGLADPYLILIRDPLVQKELRLSDRQRQAITAITDELDITLWTLRNQPAEKAAEGFRALIAKAETRMKPILSDAQHKRLAQTRLSVAGLQVLLRDDLASKLKLSPEQRTRIEKALEKTNASEAPRPKTNGKTVAGKPTSPANNTSTRVAAILSREQLASARELLGPAMDGSKLGYVRFRAPELEGQEGWLNSDPLAMTQLQGKVVALHFWTFGCINCQRNFPWYRGWHESFAERGLTIIGVHTPETEGERNSQTVQQKAGEAKFAFPILIDNHRRNWNAWGNSMWPSVYLIDKHGYVRYWWLGELNWEGAEGEKILRGRIEELLGEK